MKLQTPHVVLLLAASRALAVQPGAPLPVAAPLRALPWGQLNFLHTTDTHGWHGGHQQEASYAGDWGDYISFAHHLRRGIADPAGVDLLLVDTGDRVEGNGLYDGSEPKGRYTFDIFKHQHIDLLCSGNHELYKANSSNNELFHTVPNFRGNYLASNLDIYNPKTGQLQPLAARYKKLVTPHQKIRITAFGFIFNFQGNANNTVVQRVQDTVKEPWFKEAIRDKQVDLFVIVGHVAIRSEEYDAIFRAIRAEQWDTPIQFFGGHTHVRDYKRYDDKAVALESGRYMETYGFQSIDGLRTGGAADASPKPQGSVTFQRRYIDNNLHSLYHHSHTDASNFTTKLGRQVTNQITAARKALRLDTRRGCAPQDYWMNRAPANDSSSIFRLLAHEILPVEMEPKEKEGSIPKIVLTNTGAIRFDIFKGPFTRDSEFLISPFDSGFRYVKAVDWSVAKNLLALLNQGGPILSELEQQALVPPEQLAFQAGRLQAPVAARQHDQVLFKNQPALIPGYTTVDDDGETGDDTIHSRITYYATPNCIQSNVSFPADGSEPEKVDVVYNEFIEKWVLKALQFLGRTEHLETAYYDERSMTDILADWVQTHWPC